MRKYSVVVRGFYEIEVLAQTDSEALDKAIEKEPDGAFFNIDHIYIVDDEEI